MYPETFLLFSQTSTFDRMVLYSMGFQHFSGHFLALTNFVNDYMSAPYISILNTLWAESPRSTYLADEVTAKL